jgi:hypothetical protein
MGLVISTDDKGLKIWRDDKGNFPRYSYSISRKNDQDKWVNVYKDVKFKNGVEVANGTVISIKNAFESFNISKDGKKYPYLMISDFEVMDGGDIQIPDVPAAPDGQDTVPFK